MQIEIKKALLEGYTPEVIVEAVHANHPKLNKRNPYTKAYRDVVAQEISGYRKDRDQFRNKENISKDASRDIIKNLHKIMPLDGSRRDFFSKADIVIQNDPIASTIETNAKNANLADNKARALSITGNLNGIINSDDPVRFMKNRSAVYPDNDNLSDYRPRIISSAKQ